MTEPTPISDPKVLRAIAHPVRLQILNIFDTDGPQRAADIADKLDIPANQASFHLRQLAKYGLVVDDPELARDRRDRVWKPAMNEISVDTSVVAAMPGGKAAVAAFRGVWVGEVQKLLNRVAALDDKRPAGEFGHASTRRLLLTRDEIAEVTDRIGELLDEHRERKSADAPANAVIYEIALLVAPEEI